MDNNNTCFIKNFRLLNARKVINKPKLWKHTSPTTIFIPSNQSILPTYRIEVCLCNCEWGLALRNVQLPPSCKRSGSIISLQIGKKPTRAVTSLSITHCFSFGLCKDWEGMLKSNTTQTQMSVSQPKELMKEINMEDTTLLAFSSAGHTF